MRARDALISLAVVAGAACSSQSPSASEAALATPGGFPISWYHNVRGVGSDGERLTYACLPNGRAYTVWGTEVYTDDSSICTAAVHAGLISFADGGVVTVEIRPGQASYVASTRNGVESLAYGAWAGSYVFVTD